MSTAAVIAACTLPRSDFVQQIGGLWRASRAIAVTLPRGNSFKSMPDKWAATDLAVTE